VELVTSEVLSSALLWEHRLGSEGLASAIRLADGRTLRSSEIRGALNRLGSPIVPHLARASPADREYAAQEFGALLLSWIHSIPGPVMNRATHRGLGGPWLRPVEWMRLASDAGLDTVPLSMAGGGPVGPARQTLAQGSGRLRRANLRSVVLAAGKVFGDGPVPGAVEEGLGELGRRSGASILGATFLGARGEGWELASVTPVPDLRLGGSALLEALASALEGTAA
jgi:hypothetical protein